MYALSSRSTDSFRRPVERRRGGPATPPRSQRAQEAHQTRAVLARQRAEAVARRRALPFVCEDRALDRAGATVVQEGGQSAQAPERCGAHLARSGAVLRDPVAEAPHVVQQEVRVRRELAVA